MRKWGWTGNGKRANYVNTTRTTMALSPMIERELATAFAPSDHRTAHMMLTQYGLSPHERDVDHVRHALISLSGGNIGLLGYYLAAAQHNYKDVLYWAKHPEQAPRR
jgi:hypothetical protein